MKAFIIPVIILAVAIAAIFWVSRRTDPTPRRSGLLLGYYGCSGNQVTEVTDHTNLHWECFWSGLDKGIADIKAAGKFTVLDVGNWLFDRLTPNQLTLKSSAESQLQGLFACLRAEGALHLVKMVVPCDEPNLPENRACGDIPEAARIIRRVAANFSELDGLLVGCIYYNGTPKCQIDLFDVVGFDDYEPGANILSPNGAYEKFRETLRPGQRTLLVPGGGYGPSKWEPKQQDPAPFVSYAMSNPEVLMIVPFLWRYPNHGEDIAGIVDLPIKDAYIAAGKSIV